MSELTLGIGAVMSHLNRMCEHDLERLRKQLSIRAEKTNPDCYQCQHQAKRRKCRRSTSRPETCAGGTSGGQSRA